MATGAIATSTQSSSTARTVGRLLMWSCGGQEKRKQSFKKGKQSFRKRKQSFEKLRKGCDKTGAAKV